MKIIKFKKISGNKYKVFFENNDSIVLHEDIIIQYKLLLTKKIEDNFEEILKDNNNCMIYDMVFKYICKKMRCETEIIQYLKRKNINNDLIDKIIIKLKRNNLLNDRKYIKGFISDKVRLNNFGLNKIKKELYKLNLNKEIIEEEIELYSKDDILINLEKLIDKKIKSNKSYGGDILKQKILLDLINKGYNRDDILNILSNKNLNNIELYNKEYNKLYNKYKDKINGDELDNFIKQKLYNKGFKIKKSAQ